MVKIWEFRTKNFRVELACEEERDPELSWADEETLDNLSNGVWYNLTYRVAVFGPNGEMIGDSYLGNSIYANPSDFRDHIGINVKSRADGRNYGSYFVGMVGEAIQEARKAMIQARPYIRQSAIA